MAHAVPVDLLRARFCLEYPGDKSAGLVGGGLKVEFQIFLLLFWLLLFWHSGPS